MKNSSLYFLAAILFVQLSCTKDHIRNDNPFGMQEVRFNNWLSSLRNSDSINIGSNPSSVSFETKKGVTISINSNGLYRNCSAYCQGKPDRKCHHDWDSKPQHPSRIYYTESLTPGDMIKNSVFPIMPNGDIKQNIGILQFDLYEEQPDKNHDHVLSKRNVTVGFEHPSSTNDLVKDYYTKRGYVGRTGFGYFQHADTLVSQKTKTNYDATRSKHYFLFNEFKTWPTIDLSTNCTRDFKIEDHEKIDIAARFINNPFGQYGASPSAKVYLVLPDINCVIPMELPLISSNRFTPINDIKVKEGMRCYLVAIGFKHDKYYFAKTNPTVTKKDVDLLFEFELSSKEAIETQLNSF